MRPNRAAHAACPLRAGPSPQAGAATLVVLMLLMTGMVIVAAWAQRNSVAGLRSIGHQTRQAQALEAAEAGLAWATGQLNQGPIDDRCEPAGGQAAALSFQQRLLGPVDLTQRLVPRATEGPNPGPLPARCLMAADGWACRCPQAGQPPSEPPDDGQSPAFQVHFEPTLRPGQVQLVSIGCSQRAPPCSTGPGPAADASTRLRLTLALLPRLRAAPGAALLAQGSIDHGTAALGLHAPDGSGGAIAAHVGGHGGTSALRLSTTGGGDPALALKAEDAALRSLPPGRLHARHLGMSVAAWSRQPGVRRIDCRTACEDALTQALAQAVAAGDDLPRLHVHGDLSLTGPRHVGEAGRPVLLVIDGDLRLDGAVKLHGVVMARDLLWNGVAEGGGGLIKGAVVLSGGYRGDAAGDVVHDSALVRALQRQQGLWVVVPGSWRDL